MGDARRRGAVNLAELKRLIQSGPPDRPTLDRPGELLKTLIDMFENSAGPPTPRAAAMAVMHVLDMERWKHEVDRFNQIKSLVDAADARVIIPH